MSDEPPSESPATTPAKRRPRLRVRVTSRTDDEGRLVVQMVYAKRASTTALEAARLRKQNVGDRWRELAEAELDANEHLLTRYWELLERFREQVLEEL